MNRRVAESHLVEQRQQERQAADADAREQIAGHRHAKTPYAQNSEAQQRVRGAQRVQAVGAEQGEGDDEQSHDLACAQGVLAENLEDIG